jgi:hypothetical protein
VARPNPTKAEVDRVVRALLATVPEPPRRWPNGVVGTFQIGERSFEITGFTVEMTNRLNLADHGIKFDQAMVTGPTLPDADLPAFLRPIPKMELGRLMDAALQIAARRMRTYPDGCTCPKLPANSTPQTYNLDCPIGGHQRLALAARHRRC